MLSRWHAQLVDIRRDRSLEVSMPIVSQSIDICIHLEHDLTDSHSTLRISSVIKSRARCFGKATGSTAGQSQSAFGPPLRRQVNLTRRYA